MPRITITVPDRNPQPYRFQLDRLAVSLGRGQDNDIPIDSGSVSVRHAEMRRVEGGYELRDLGSTNGIKLNDERMEVIPLYNGAGLALGDVRFDFVLEDDELELLAREHATTIGEVARSRESLELPPLPESPPVDDRDEVLEPVAGGISGGTIFLLLVLLAAAFFAGMALRFQKETGKSLIQTLIDGRQVVVIEVLDAPAAASQSGRN